MEFAEIKYRNDFYYSIIILKINILKNIFFNINIKFITKTIMTI